MPLYDFKCGGCGAVQEVLQSYSAPPPTHCANVDDASCELLCVRRAWA
jgi:putative FmdB family regulatory protein